MNTSLTPQLKVALRREVFSILEGMFTDPDFGLELSARAKRRLRLAKKSGTKRVSLSDMRRRYY